MKIRSYLTIIAALGIFGTAGGLLAKDSRLLPICQGITIKKPGAPCTTILRLDDGTLLTVNGNSTMRSRDNGKSWGERKRIVAGFGLTEVVDGVPQDMVRLLKTRTGAIVMVWRDERVDDWLKGAEGVGPKARGAVWAARSTDNGATWSEPQRVFDGVCGHPPISLIQTKNGNIVFPLQFCAAKPLRNVIRSCISSDDGLTWKMGDIIDLGGKGHHDGAMEPNIIELRDGRVWMIIRTNWDRYWDAFSEDGGVTWKNIKPGAISASSSPPYIARLQSGRLLLIWNRLHPEGNPDYVRTQPGDEMWAATAASWHRGELSAALSDDEGATWSKPVILAREEGKSLAYVEIFEPEPGKVCFVTAQGKLAGSFRESDLLKNK